MPEIELNPYKIYKMPKPLFYKNFNNKILVISRDTGNWLVLNNLNQLKIFHFLKRGNKVLDLFKNFSNELQSDIYNVLIELEAKKFENTIVNYPQEHGMYMYLTNNCNQRCRHCYMFAGEKDLKELSTNDIITILKEFASNGGKVITFTGGEATLRKDFILIVTKAKQFNLKVCVLTNGLLWTSTFIKKVKPF